MAVVVNCCYISKTELNQGINAKGHLMWNSNTHVPSAKAPLYYSLLNMMSNCLVLMR